MLSCLVTLHQSHHQMETVLPIMQCFRDCRPRKALLNAKAWKMSVLGLPRPMEMSVDEALAACADPLVASRLQTLPSLGAGYLILGEATPSLSGGGGPAAQARQRDGQGAG